MQPQAARFRAPVITGQKSGPLPTRTDMPRVASRFSADADFVGGVVVLMFFACLGAALGLLGLLLRL